MGSRYFAEHAKNAQREYLNFLSNAEREEFQETTAAQSLELERSNVRVETARLEQTRLELEVAKLGSDLATLVRENAIEREKSFKEFDKDVEEIAGTGAIGQSFGGLAGLFGVHPLLGALDVAGVISVPQVVQDIGRTGITGIADVYSGGAASNQINLAIGALQRDFEKLNLRSVRREALAAKRVADKQLDAARAGLTISAMQRTAALMRHEHAVQNLTFLRGRVLNAEMWHRLADMVRSVSASYMRYAVELAFLAEQAYEFEADKRLNVIRFDYDVSEEGSLLAADFLLRDLDTLEHDLLVGRRQSEQQVRYVASLAREFPEALQELRDSGSTIFTLRLEQLERRFPGLFNLRIATVDVAPIALMDSTRFSLELTNLGLGQVRLRAQADTPVETRSPSVLNTNDLEFEPEEDGLVDPWLAEFAEQWPTKIRVTGPQAFVFSGLTAQDRTAAFPFASSSQRNAFEGLPAASTWRMNMSLSENQVVPGTLADVLVTFTLAGYHDPLLRQIVDTAGQKQRVLTQWLSGQQRFADAFFEFARSGRMDWEVSEHSLTLIGPAGSLRNLAVVLVPQPAICQFCPLASYHNIRFRITDSGQLDRLTSIPEIKIELSRLTAKANAVIDGRADVSWAFEEGDSFQAGASQEHTFSRPGRHTIRLRIIQDGRLSEFRARLAVSRQRDLMPPLTAVPKLSVVAIEGSGPELRVTLEGTVEAPGGPPITAVWRIDGVPETHTGTSADFDGLVPGTYTLSVSAIRVPSVRIYSRQRHLPETILQMNGLNLSSNRTFDPTSGTETTNNPNSLTVHLFDSGPIRPVDRWTLELLLTDNEFLRSVTQSDAEEIDLTDIADAVLSLEYESSA